MDSMTPTKWGKVDPSFKFLKNYCTSTCLAHLTDKITTRFEKGRFTGMILIDSRMAFDTDHQILKKNMKYLGFSKAQLLGLNTVSENKNLLQISTLVTPTHRR